MDSWKPLSRVVACCVVVALAVAEGVLGAKVPAAFASVLAAHNTYRATHGAPALVWNPTLASRAQKWARNCKRGHNPEMSTLNFGQNIWYGRKGYTNQRALSTAPGSWYKEILTYNFANPGASTGVTGHFTQLVWKGTTSVGCGVVTTCNTVFTATFTLGSLVVCDYSPTGNLIDDKGGYSLYIQNVKRKVAPKFSPRRSPKHFYKLSP